MTNPLLKPRVTGAGPSQWWPAVRGGRQRSEGPGGPRGQSGQARGTGLSGSRGRSRAPPGMAPVSISVAGAHWHVSQVILGTSPTVLGLGLIFPRSFLSSLTWAWEQAWRKGKAGLPGLRFPMHELGATSASGAPEVWVGKATRPPRGPESSLGLLLERASATSGVHPAPVS